MTKQEVLENIAIARKALNTFSLLLPDSYVIFDCYCLPSFRWKAFYAQIGRKNGVYFANCAYTRYADHFGLESNSVHFISIIENTHRAKKTDIICKCIFPKADVVNRLIETSNDPSAAKNSEEGIVIDGITVGLRFFENGNITRSVCLINPDDNIPLVNEIIAFSDMI